MRLSLRNSINLLNTLLSQIASGKVPERPKSVTFWNGSVDAFHQAIINHEIEYIKELSAFVKHKLTLIAAPYIAAGKKHSKTKTTKVETERNNTIKKLESVEADAIKLANAKEIFTKEELIAKCLNVEKKMLDIIPDLFNKMYSELPGVKTPLDSFLPNFDNSEKYTANEITSKLQKIIDEFAISAVSPLAREHWTQMSRMQEKVDRYFGDHGHAIAEDVRNIWEDFKHEQISAAHQSSNTYEILARLWPLTNVDMQTQPHNLLDYLNAKIRDEIVNLNGIGKQFQRKIDTFSFTVIPERSSTSN